MSGRLDPITVEVQFNGECYLAEITPTINGNPVTLRPEMYLAEATQYIYTNQLQTMLSKQELTTAYGSADHGFLTQATLNGFVFERGSIDHATITTEVLWKDFVDSLHKPEPFLSAAPRPIGAPAPSEAGPGLQALFGNISAYRLLSAEEKKAVHTSAFFKRLKEAEGENIDPYTDEENQYLRYIIGKDRIPSTEKETIIGQLYHNLCNPENCDEAFDREGMKGIHREWLRIRKINPPLNPSLELLDSSVI